MLGCAIVKGIVRRGDSTVLVSVEVSNDCGREIVDFILLDTLFEELMIERGDEVGDILSSLDHYSSVTAAYSSALSSLAYVQSSLKALYRKLIIKGFAKDVSREAIDIIRERGFVDEEAIAIRRAELMVEKLWGRSRILKKLFEEGFPSEIIEKVSDSLDEVDFSERCASAIAKRYSCIPDDRRERDKMYAALMRLGYSSSDIREALSQIQEND